MDQRNHTCWCGSGKKWKKCHYPLKNSDPRVDLARQYYKNYKIFLKNDQQIEGIRAASQLAAKILNQLCNYAKEGISTLELDALANQLHQDAGAIPAPLHYGHPPFPKSICTSINEVICHGIPSETRLKSGDILNIDVTSILNGFYGDCSRMVMIGEVDQEKKLVTRVSYECLMKAIEILKPGTLLSKIGEVIEAHATLEGCSVVNQFVGHGIGLHFHESPQVSHNRNSLHIPLTAGMTFTIEPMINAGVREAVIDSKDRWTARTADGRASAQWEHTILINENGSEILTLVS